MAYTSRELSAPRLAGTSLRLFAALAEAWGVGSLIRSQMLAQAGIDRLRTAPVGDEPLERPVWPPRPDAAATEPDPDINMTLAPDVGGFRFPTIADYAEAYRAGRTDPFAIARAVIEAKRRTDEGATPLRAFIAMDEADLLAQAEASARRYRDRTPLGPLDGVPIAVKDELDQVPYPTTVGTSFLGNKPATADATVVSRLRAEGALLIGKANMHELGIGVTGINPNHGAARNPYDPSRATGGSSSGSASAAAAGFCPVSIGADGGGSIRIPAAMCGMVGLKPTFGRVSERGAAPLCWSVAHVGPIGASVQDVATIYGIVAGVDPADPGTHGQPPMRVAGGGVSGLRLGIERSFFEAAHPAVVAACDAMVKSLERDGARVVAIDLPDPDLARLAHLVIIVSEMAGARMSDPADARFGTDTRLSFALARGFEARDYVHALRLRHRLGVAMQKVYAEVDVILTPTTACTAPIIRADALATGESDIPLLDRIMRFAVAANLFGLPAITVPAGYDPDGLPIGLQAMGRPWEEDVLIRVALAAEGLVQRRKPKVWVGPEL